MNPKIDYSNFLMPNLGGFASTFPYIRNHQRQNLYVLFPTINPMAYNFVEELSNWGNSSNGEEIFPDFRCKSCSIAVPTYSEYKDHLKTHCNNKNVLKTNSSRYQALQSLAYAKKRISVLKPLVKNKDPLDLHCSQCPETFKCHSDLEEHTKKHLGIRKITCVICKSRFAGVSSLRKHLLMFHCKNRDRKPCPYCSYRCFQTSDLEKHIARRHTRDFKYKCSHCVKGFATPKELRNHERRKHPDIVKVVPEACTP